MEKRIVFWVKEGNQDWWFEDEINGISDIDRVGRRIDMVARSAEYFWSEEPLNKELISLLMRAVWTERAKLLLSDLL
jgi:hypothetical protein